MECCRFTWIQCRIILRINLNQKSVHRREESPHLSFTWRHSCWCWNPKNQHQYRALWKATAPCKRHYSQWRIRLRKLFQMATSLISARSYHTKPSSLSTVGLLQRQQAINKVARNLAQWQYLPICVVMHCHRLQWKNPTRDNNIEHNTLTQVHWFGIMIGVRCCNLLLMQYGIISLVAAAVDTDDLVGALCSTVMARLWLGFEG